MHYVGGKRYQAKAVAEVIEQHRGDRTRYLEPFIGGGSVFARVAPTFEDATGADVVPDLVMLWQAVCDGWSPPERLSRQEWSDLREAVPSQLRAWAGYAGSYGGMWFRAYARERPPKDCWRYRWNSLRRKADAVAGHARFVCADYGDHLVTPETVVYCDPPYAGTLGYDAAGEFDSERFWRTAERWGGIGALVLVHEFAAPAHWVPLHQAQRPTTICTTGAPASERSRTETLYAHPLALQGAEPLVLFALS